MERQQKDFKRSGRAHLILGIILMFFGLFLIVDLADIIPWRMRDFIFTWQALLIFIGVIFVSGRESKPTGFILMAIGTFFLLPRFIDEIPYYWNSLFWPSMLILLGLVVIFGRGKNGRMIGHKKKVSSDGYLDDVDVFGGSDRIVSSQNFKGGKVTHVFGGSKYDFTGAMLAEGENVLELTMVFGGTKFIVPESWNIKVEVTSIFGGFSDKRIRSIVVKDSDRVLIIRGIMAFGGGEIVNYH